MAERVIGVTGGIGSGKSSVMRAFQAKGIEAVDADDMARVVVEPGQPALNAIAEHFGPDILTPEGTLNRPSLRTIIFSDPDAKTWLEALLHPLINRELRSRLAAAQGPYALLVSPLLFETGQDKLVDRILVVDVPESVQLARASARDGADPEQIRRIMASQMSREERLRRADDVLDNSGDLADLERQVGELHGKYRV
ncbi:dephospho-CoA kinase [Marinimicrobium koreense]|uniref:Dephospho-CoA kinase n=1 Tax=Marinimicrobium koreense TaxID=306545 RepID=A0A3N1P2B5_9GAMM|nr:dephospho-CoA kinase [Marinimicrobium koreense]ROQ20870.1 dephospho-CoA kinase [Marinimicrobium koreense]